MKIPVMRYIEWPGTEILQNLARVEGALKKVINIEVRRRVAIERTRAREQIEKAQNRIIRAENRMRNAEYREWRAQHDRNQAVIALRDGQAYARQIGRELEALRAARAASSEQQT